MGARRSVEAFEVAERVLLGVNGTERVGFSVADVLDDELDMAVRGKGQPWERRVCHVRESQSLSGPDCNMQNARNFNQDSQGSETSSSLA